MKVRAIPVEMIGWFDFRGDINPVSFKFDIDKEEFNGKIKKIQNRYDEKLAGNPVKVFVCQVEINNLVRMAEFKYDLNTHKWLLFKL